jgi:hypothetical protein
MRLNAFCPGTTEINWIMAKGFGQSGRYVSQEAVNKGRRWVTLAIVIEALLGVTCGVFLSPPLPKTSLLWPAKGLLTMATVAAMMLIWKWADRKFAVLERDRMNLRRRASGETLVGVVLREFPGDFRVINALKTPFGNLDHVVVGPTGVFVLETKNWRGLVASDGKGELLCNGRPADKPYIREYVGKLMGIKARVKALAPGLDPYLQPLLVFTSAKVDATWGTTRSVHCLREDQLSSYVVESKRGQRLSAQDIDTLVRAFCGLAHIDPNSAARAERLERPRVAAIVERERPAPPDGFRRLKPYGHAAAT